MDTSFMYDGSDLSTHNRMELTSYDSNCDSTGGGVFLPLVKQEGGGDRPYHTLALASPELENMFIGSTCGGSITTFPTPDMDPTGQSREIVQNSKSGDTVTDNKRQFSSGFDVALQKLYRERGHPFAANDRSDSPRDNCAITATADQEPSIKFENLPSTTSRVASPFDRSEQQVPCRITTVASNTEGRGVDREGGAKSLARLRPAYHEHDQDRLKLEHRRARNREAAIRCRTKKLHRISDMEGRVKDLRRQNSDLTTTINSHKTEIIRLKKIILEHSQQGCGVVTSMMHI